MPHTEIKKNIDALQGELENVSAETSTLKKTLEDARENIEEYTPDALQQLADILQNEAEAFEVEHPTLTAMINHVMTSLSNFGI